MQRPTATQVNHKCERCDAPIKIILNWWTEDGGKTYTQDTVETVDRNERICEPCLDARMAYEERSRELMADVPPSDFDPTYCGEVWRED